jgi:hypothetical protein
MKTVVARERESSPGGREGNRMKRKLMKVENTRLYPQQRHISNHSLRLYSSLSIENREKQAKLKKLEQTTQIPSLACPKAIQECNLHEKDKNVQNSIMGKPIQVLQSITMYFHTMHVTTA